MSTPQHNQNQTLEEKLAAVNALMGQQAATSSETSAKKTSMACPIDPAERALCEGCQ